MSDTLRNRAAALLAKHNNDPRAALPDFERVLRQHRELFSALALEFLQRLGQRPLDAQSPGAQTAAAGQSSIDAHAAGAGGGTSPPPPRKKTVSVVAHRRSKAAKRAAIAAAAGTMRGIAEIHERQVFGRAIGDYAYRELRPLLRDLSRETASYLMDGIDRARWAIWVKEMIDHETPLDDSMKVRDLYSAAMLAELQKDASTKTQPAIAIFIERELAPNLTTYIEKLQ